MRSPLAVDRFLLRPYRLPSALLIDHQADIPCPSWGLHRPGAIVGSRHLDDGAAGGRGRYELPVPPHGTEILRGLSVKPNCSGKNQRFRPSAQPGSAFFHAGGGVDLIGEAVTIVLQELIVEKATEQIGAATNGDRHYPSEGSVALGTQPPTWIHSQRGNPVDGGDNLTTQRLMHGFPSH